MPTPLRLYNSRTRQLETFEPLHGNEARVYTCGPTVYNYPHIGNMRAYVFADTLGRVLRFKGYDLKHVINITDVGHLTDDADAGEDKLEKAASERAQSIWDIARHYTEAFWADVKALNIREPFKWSIATDYVPAMIDFATSIADKHCYQIESGLYFDTTTVPEYASLAGRTKQDQVEYDESAWMRIDEVTSKRHAADFAIWRTTPPGEARQMEWDSPWGRGAPGWHLECSVMSEALLGLPFDIHTGGIDHREIHHPNEIAQNQARCASDHSGARIWMHNNFLIDRTGKMSKSGGEFLRLQTLIDRGFHPLSYRLMCLQAHYRSELEFSWENLLAAQVRLKRMVISVDQLKRDAPSSNPSLPSWRENWEEEFDRELGDDLSTVTTLAHLDVLMSWRVQNASCVLDLLEKVDDVLGLNLLALARADLRIRPATATITEADIEARLAERKTALAAKDFATSDRIRDELAAAGVEVMDGDLLGWDWKPIIS